MHLPDSNNYILGEKNTIVDDIFDMMSSGYVNIVYSLRLSYIHIEKLQIAVTEGSKPNDFLQNIIEKYYKKFIVDMLYMYSAIGVCPYILIKKYYNQDTEKLFVLVPIALEPKSFDISAKLDENHEKQFTVKFKSDILNSSYTDLEYKSNKNKKHPEIHILKSEYYKGPSAINPLEIDSEGGRIFKDNVKYNTKMKQIDKLFNDAINPIIWLQSENMGQLRPNETEQDIVAKVGLLIHNKSINGNKDDSMKVEYNHSNGTAIIPKHYIPSSYQPRIEPHLLSTTELTKNYHEMVDLGFKMPLQNMKHDTAAFNSRNESSIDEDRAKQTANIGQLIAAITPSIQDVWFKIFAVDKVHVSIPVRIITDMTTIFNLLKWKFIDRKIACEELLKIVGIDQSRLKDMEILNLDNEEDFKNKRIKLEKIDVIDTDVNKEEIDLT
jgi:hypothetical protein